MVMLQIAVLHAREHPEQLSHCVLIDTLHSHTSCQHLHGQSEVAMTGAAHILVKIDSAIFDRAVSKFSRCAVTFAKDMIAHRSM